MDKEAKALKSLCPTCQGERNSLVVGRDVVSFDEDGISGSTTSMLLKCCGCDTVYFRQDVWFSEWDEIDEHPFTGQQYLKPGIKTTYFPSPAKRHPPEWVSEIGAADRVLGALLDELYVALNSDLRVLAAIGARTAFDRASELLGVSETLTFARKLDELVTIGKIGADERINLNVLVDAGSAAAHRGWAPKPKELTTMMEVVEPFLYRSFVLGDGINKLKASVPSKVKAKSAKSTP